METELKFAILIDADNISDKYIKIILEETANSGVATYKRIYGDWTSPQLASWKSVLLDNSIIPMQQYSYTSGKNATDCAMIIDAMDILYSGTVDGFCIASSDSDFTRLVARLRESGMQVIGMGESKTPKPFIAACNQFKYLDLLFSNQQKKEKKAAAERPLIKEIRSSVKEKSRASKKESAAPPPEDIQPQSDLDVIKLTIAAIVEKFSDEDGWIFSGKLGDQLSKRLPDFDVRNFGYAKLTPFVKSLGDYEINRISNGSHQQQIYFKAK
ncbi:NYN domain-containing protein [Ruminococcus gauvreauii]|uniref:NYN domain-containing protein n=1 Tax=Ruminococcus gauvreauii TaxID=438033 RepID=A0ABY5VJB7_9FIRM|nr:NYN domain-containing protein [Ruminococcus gauvreauii]UWP60654.1 NYN domain-containing protein [Ruminococcus gauvreauii]